MVISVLLNDVTYFSVTGLRGVFVVLIMYFGRKVLPKLLICKVKEEVKLKPIKLNKSGIYF
jgi:hypothetical protein